MEDMKHSTGTVLFALETGPLLLEFPFLHTLEVARGAVGICHYIRAPLLRTFILDMFRYSSERWANLPEEHLPLITNILGPATNITLYNMGSYPTSMLHRIIKVPQRLERLTLVDETMPPRQTSIPPIHHGLMMNLIIFNEALHSLTSRSCGLYAERKGCDGTATTSRSSSSCLNAAAHPLEDAPLLHVSACRRPSRSSREGSRGWRLAAETDSRYCTSKDAIHKHLQRSPSRRASTSTASYPPDKYEVLHQFLSSIRSVLVIIYTPSLPSSL